MRHWPGFGRCPGGTPSVAAVLGPPSERASGTTSTVRVVRVHPAATARPSAVMTTGSDRMPILGVAGGHNMWNRVPIGKLAGRLGAYYCCDRMSGFSRPIFLHASGLALLPLALPPLAALGPPRPRDNGAWEE